MRGPDQLSRPSGLLLIAFGPLSAIPRPGLEVNEGCSRPRRVDRPRGHVLTARSRPPLAFGPTRAYRVMSCNFCTLAQANGGRVARGLSPVYVSHTTSGPGTRSRQRPILCIGGPGSRLGAAALRRLGRVIYYIAQENYPVSKWSTFPPAGWSATRCGRLRWARPASRRHTGVGAQTCGFWPSAELATLLEK